MDPFNQNHLYQIVTIKNMTFAKKYSFFQSLKENIHQVLPCTLVILSWTTLARQWSSGEADQVSLFIITIFNFISLSHYLRHLS